MPVAVVAADAGAASRLLLTSAALAVPTTAAVAAALATQANANAVAVAADGAIEHAVVVAAAAVAAVVAVAGIGETANEYAYEVGASMSVHNGPAVDEPPCSAAVLATDFQDETATPLRSAVQQTPRAFRPRSPPACVHLEHD